MSFVPSHNPPANLPNFLNRPQTKNGNPSHLTNFSKNQKTFFDFFLINLSLHNTFFLDILELSSSKMDHSLSIDVENKKKVKARFYNFFGRQGCQMADPLTAGICFFWLSRAWHLSSLCKFHRRGTTPNYQIDCCVYNKYHERIWCNWHTCTARKMPWLYQKYEISQISDKLNTIASCRIKLVKLTEMNPFNLFVACA